MARYWSTLILAGVLAGLGLYLYLVELPDQRTEVATATQAKQILPFTEAQITSLTVRSQSGEVVLTTHLANPGPSPHPFKPTPISGRCRP
jgi:hypothetical protein